MKKRQGKVIKHFTVEFDPTIGANPSNPFSMLSDEERLKDFIETFSLLWAESCRESVGGDSNNCLSGAPSKKVGIL